MVCPKPMTITMNHDREGEWEEVARRMIAQLQEHLFLQQIDEDGRLRRTAKVLDLKRGCRR